MSAPDPLADKSAALSETLVHVLRNQIAAIAGYTDLVDKSGPLNPDQALFLERAQETAARLNIALPVLAECAWLEADLPIRHEPVPFDEVFRAARRSVTPLLFERDGELNGAVISAPVVMGDRDRLVRLLTELLRNALQYSETAPRVEVVVLSEDDQLVCKVRDFGYGMSVEDAELAFDRLYRSRDTRVRAVPGSGLGLTLARLIARRHAGTIALDSTPDAGSTLTLRLPLAAG